MFNPKLDELVKQKFGPNIPSMTELEHRSAIAFVNTNPAFNIPAPIPENVIPVGGMHIGDTKPLPKVIMPLIFFINFKFFLRNGLK